MSNFRNTEYIEIMICQSSYHTPYQPETPISARDSRISPRAEGQGLIRESRADVSRVDTRYDMKTDIS